MRTQYIHNIKFAIKIIHILLKLQNHPPNLSILYCFLQYKCIIFGMSVYVTVYEKEVDVNFKIINNVNSIHNSFSKNYLCKNKFK